MNPMDYMQMTFLVSCVVLFFVPVWFVAHEVYDDGLFGRIGLLGIASAAAMFLLEAWDETAFAVPPKAVLLTASIAWFLVWHMLRFHGRVRLGWFGKDRRRCHDQRSGDAA